MFGKKDILKKQQRVQQNLPTPTPNQHTPVNIQRALEDPESLTADEVQSLQESHGNQFVNNLIGSNQTQLKHPVQMKMTVTPAGDKFEQEADAVASKVVQNINSPAADTAQREMPEDELAAKRIQREMPEDELAAKRIQREMPEDELAAKRIQREMPEDELAAKRIQREMPEDELAAKRIQRAAPEDELAAKRIQRSAPEDELAAKRIQRAAPEDELAAKRLQRVEDPLAGGEVDNNIETEIEGARGKGESLPDSIRGPIESQMGADFSGVKVHTDAHSDALNHSVQAKAFTTGQDIFFRQGEYNPGSKDGQELLAHELTHVVQQNPNVQAKRDEQ